MTTRIRRMNGVAILTLTIALIGASSTALIAQEGNTRISQNARLQIAAMAAEKAGRTPAQRKLDSNLLYEAKRSRRETAAIPSTLVTGVAVDADGRTVVDIVAPVDDPILERLTALGATVIDYRLGYRNIRAAVPVSALETIAGWPEVLYVNRKQEYMLSNPGSRGHRWRPSVRRFLRRGRRAPASRNARRSSRVASRPP